MATPIRHRKLLEYPTNATFFGCPFQCNPQFNPTRICSLDCTTVCPGFCHPIYSPTPSPATTPYATLTPPDHHDKPALSLPLKISIAFLIATFLYTIYKFYTVWCRSQPIGTNTIIPPVPQPVWENEETEVEVDHPIWYIRTTGLQQSVINGLTVVKFRKTDGLRVVEGSDCTVCLTEFEEDDTLRLLPNCKHAFHVSCIDTWLRSHVNCPLCRAVIVNDTVDAGLSGRSDNDFGVVRDGDLGVSSIRDGDRGEASGSSGLRNGENEDAGGNDNSVK